MGFRWPDIREYPKGYQPPTSFDEIELAKQMILKSEYGGRVVGLEVRGIITESEDDHRHIYLTFRKPDRRKVLQITVDMTADKIVLAEEK